jgi:hypothetical protein
MLKILLPAEGDESGSEGVWVKRVSANTGEINNLPFLSRKYKFGDIIEFDPKTNEAVQLVRDGGYSPTRIITYRCRFEDEKKRLETEGYIIEGICVGFVAVTKYLGKH